MLGLPVFVLGYMLLVLPGRPFILLRCWGSVEPGFVVREKCILRRTRGRNKNQQSY